jgi:hypothetical protein
MRVIASDFALKEFVVFVICAAERCSSWADAKWALEHLQVAAVLARLVSLTSLLKLWRAFIYSKAQENPEQHPRGKGGGA